MEYGCFRIVRLYVLIPNLLLLLSHLQIYLASEQWVTCSSRKRLSGCVKKAVFCTELIQPAMNSLSRSNRIEALLAAVYWLHLTPFGPPLMRMISSLDSVSAIETHDLIVFRL